MISISTKKGDAGWSSLIGGQPISKDASVFMVLGDLDELNSWIGVIIALLKKQIAQNDTDKKFFKSKKFIKQLLSIQEDLFILSAQIAGFTKRKLTASKLKKLEANARKLQVSLGRNWCSKFVYPGGSELAAWTDVARALARRSERSLVCYSRHNLKLQKNSPRFLTLFLKYLNRLSDYLYLLRHKFNELQQITEVKF